MPEGTRYITLYMQFGVCESWAGCSEVIGISRMCVQRFVTILFGG